MPGSSVKFFPDAGQFRRWLETNHDRHIELWVGFYKKRSGRTGLDYPTAVDVALCFGWIDGIRKALDEESYVNRFTPRKARSVWSRVNIAKVEALIARGEMHQAGLDAYAKRDDARSGIYSFEQRPEAFPPELERRFRASRAAWGFFEDQPPGYRRLAIWWVVSAKRDDTRERRLTQLIDVSARGLRLGVLFGQTGTVKPKAAKRPEGAPRATTVNAKRKTTTARPTRAPKKAARR
ncbi:MAG: YdeI family protein [Vicinamibacterales bacterium]